MNLLTPSEITSYTGDLISHFDTFKRKIIVYKQDLVSYTDINTTSYPGYQNFNNPTNVTATLYTGIFYGMKVGPEKQGNTDIPSINTFSPESNTYIKVDAECRNFINSGKTEKLEIDGITFVLASQDKVKNYLGLIYYIYDIERAN